MKSSVIPSTKNSCSGSPLIFEKGRTAIAGGLPLEFASSEESGSDFTDAINKEPDGKRVAERARGATAYRYMSAPDDITEKFLKQVKKNY